MTVTTVLVIVQKPGNEPSATRLTMSDRDAGLIAGALSRCAGLIPGEIASTLSGAFSQLQNVVAQDEPIGAVSIPEARTAEQRKADMGDSDQRTVNADRVSQPPPTGINPVAPTQQATNPMEDVRRAAGITKPTPGVDTLAPGINGNAEAQPIDPNAPPGQPIDAPLEGIRETPAGQPLEGEATETKSSDKRKR